MLAASLVLTFTPNASAELTFPGSEELYEAGRTLFEQYAPDEVKAQFEYPSKEEWDQFLQRLQATLQGNDLQELASIERETRAALAAFRVIPGYEDYVDWLEERLDYIEAAGQAGDTPPTPATPPPATPPEPETKSSPSLKPSTSVPALETATIPHYDLWLGRMKARPVPKSAAEHLPALEEIFVKAGLPRELVWLAEAESTFNPEARSPVGALGLFQLMPATARDLGLSTALPDERADPAKNAHAAARYLRHLHRRFGDWPLALAAYNAGPGRVGRTLHEHKATSFAEIAAVLPAETRMYVPKVLATLAVRTGVTADRLPPPSG
jgi:membrane-bound lytic murein transglycosylase D